jgi:hypothetical protein
VGECLHWDSLGCNGILWETWGKCENATAAQG